MTGRRTMVAAVSMALLSMTGLVGMLVVEGGRDTACFALAVLPLAVGAVSWCCGTRAPR